MCVGPRRYVITPLYSQHVRGGGKGVKQRSQVGGNSFAQALPTVATTFGPVCFGKQALYHAPG